MDARALAFGAGIALAIGVPTALVSLALDATDRVDDDSAVVYLAAAIVVAGLGIGGGVAAARRPDTPLRHGAAAALLAFAVVGGLRLLRRAVDEEELRWGALAMGALVAAWAGVVGALISEMRVSRRRRGGTA